MTTSGIARKLRRFQEDNQPRPRKPAVPARLRRRQTDRLEPRERAAVLSQQLRSEPIALDVQSLESGAIGLKALRLTAHTFKERRQRPTHRL